MDYMTSGVLQNMMIIELFLLLSLYRRDRRNISSLAAARDLADRPLQVRPPNLIPGSPQRHGQN
jgi:hypothetical protein